MCEYCEIKPVFKKDILGYSVYNKEESQRVLRPGGMHSDLVMGVDSNGKIYLEADEGQDFLWYPAFCPVCGRSLKNK